MKRRPVTFIFWGLLLCMGGIAYGQLQDVEISATRQRVDQSKSHDGSGAPVTITTQDVVYNVTVQNKTFKPITDLQVKYMIFYQDPKLGNATKQDVDLSDRGANSFPLLAAGANAQFTTKPLKLTTEAFDAGWYSPQGGGSAARDRIIGVWFRAYANGKMIGEYANPSTIAKREGWKE